MNKSLVNWLVIVLFFVCIGSFEWLYAVFGKVVFYSDLKVAYLLFVHMLFFSIFQLFSGSLIDYFGIKITIALASFCSLIGMILQVFISTNLFFVMLFLSQFFLTFGASFTFIGIGYVSRRFFSSYYGVMFGLAQMIYSLSYAMFNAIVFLHWVSISNFRLLTTCNIVLQGIVCILTLCVVSNPRGYNCQRNVILYDVVRQCLCNIYDVSIVKAIWLISALGSISFGMFFSCSTFLWYKINIYSNEFLAITLSYMWVGFSIGSPVSCWISNYFRDKKFTFLVFSVIQCCSLIFLLMINYKIENQYLIYIYYSIAWLFGFASGGHMIAFVIGSNAVSLYKISTACAIINGCMCIMSGLIILVVMMLAIYYDISLIILIFSILSLLLYIIAAFFSIRNTSLNIRSSF
ncbi:MFS transporter [Candidatus Neoehrlichia procyonis]|uniref:Putative membrane protein n=1 Tax=Candidatus Neoehrlichia procyonis str. RAC413 TaxID=1359163 RepID=A0A0F3NKV9_9RICK|nr:MFS transporter [Candidatus Neoehrlichia lotoris]KJV68655.1 putative membrane protein [Candidatus Neoehrlichia lotoris str. RAC413]